MKTNRNNDEEARRQAGKIIRGAAANFVKELPGKLRFSVNKGRRTPREIQAQVEIARLEAGNKEVNWLVLEMSRSYDDQVMELEARLKAATGKEEACRRDNGELRNRIHVLEGLNNGLQQEKKLLEKQLKAAEEDLKAKGEIINQWVERDIVNKNALTEAMKKADERQDAIVAISVALRDVSMDSIKSKLQFFYCKVKKIIVQLPA